MRVNGAATSGQMCGLTDSCPAFASMIGNFTPQADFVRVNASPQASVTVGYGTRR